MPRTVPLFSSRGLSLLSARGHLLSRTHARAVLPRYLCPCLKLSPYIAIKAIKVYLCFGIFPQMLLLHETPTASACGPTQCAAITDVLEAKSGLGWRLGESS